MIDFHSHILPQLDDGSRSVEESVQMLRLLRAQGVDTVALTSHFYAHQNDPAQFLERRQAALERLRGALTADMPRLLPGAEVLYFRGITRMTGLHRLRLEGTRLLLLEMPFAPWGEGEIREVVDLCHDASFAVMLAHVERYTKWQKPAVWDRLLAEGAVMQSNAGVFRTFFSRRRALRMICEGRLHVLGTDCHNMTSRRPDMDEAADALRQHLGDREAARFLDRGHDLLEEWSL